MTDYAAIAKDSRLKVLDLVYKAQTSHIGSLMGAADIFAVLFEKMDLDQDKFILSAGWKACLLYYHLWRLGRITEEELNSYCMDGSKFIGLAEPIHPDIMLAGGSMGLGLPGAVGLALAKKLKGEKGYVYVLMSDGELQCGTTWESALIAAKHKLDNLVVIVDNNGLQAMGPVEDIIGDPTKFDIWWGLDWQVENVDGHNYEALENTFRLSEGYGPTICFAKTIKGKGVPKWENDNLWHYAQVKDDDYNYARTCLTS